MPRSWESGGNAVTVLEGGGLIVELIERDGAAARPAVPIQVHGFAKAGVIVLRAALGIADRGP